MTLSEKVEFRAAIDSFRVQVGFCFDHHYNQLKVLSRIVVKLYKALHHNRGALQLKFLVISMEAAYQNESLMIDLMR